MMDISDGLLLDAARMARASGVTMAIESTAVPIATPEDRRADALRWGEDYELLFTLPAGITPPANARCVGTVEPLAGSPILLDGTPLNEESGLGYEHGSRPVT